MRVAKTIELDEDAERELRVLAKRRRIEVRLHQRALVVLLAAPITTEVESRIVHATRKRLGAAS